MNFFNKAFKFDIGYTFSNHREQFTQAVTEALNTGDTKSALKRLQTELLGSGVNLDGELIQKMDWIVRGQILRTRNFSRVYRMREIGIEELEIVAILDQKTSVICRVMDGRIIKIETAMEFIDSFLSEDPADPSFWQDKFKNPTLNLDIHDRMATADLVGKNGTLKNQLPIYHPRCRTITTASFTTRIEKSGGGAFSGKLSEKGLKGSDPRWEVPKRFDELSNLTPNEVLNRIDSLRNNSNWNPARIEKHFSKHGPDFGAADNAAYVKLSNEVLNSFDQVFSYYHNSGRRYAFYSKEKNGLVGIDPDNSEIKTFFKLDPKKTKLNDWLEIL